MSDIVLPGVSVATAVVSVAQPLVAYRIPVKPASHQTFLIQLGGSDYRFTLQWREAGLSAWILDIATAAGTPLIGGIVLVTGADLFAPYRHFNFGGELWVWNAADRSEMPTFASLGDTVNLYFITGGTLNWTFI
jgi:hypothetical protein